MLRLVIVHRRPLGRNGGLHAFGTWAHLVDPEPPRDNPRFLTPTVYFIGTTLKFVKGRAES